MGDALKVGLVRYVNFGPFSDSSLDFSTPGVTGIEGRITWKPGSSSNGSGKSFLYDGIAWCLFGRCLRADYKGDDVVRICSTGGASVEVSIVGGPDSIVVRRYRKHPTHKNRVYVFLNDKDVSRGTDVETQAVIVHLLGLDFDSFQNSVAFGAREDVRSFFAAPDAQRKQVLDQILGLSVYSRAEEIARKRLKEVQFKVSPKATERTRLEGVIANQKAMAEQLSASNDIETLKLQEAEARLRVRFATQAVERQKTRVEEARAHAEEETRRTQDEEAAWKAASVEYMRAKSAAERDLRTASAKNATETTNLTHATTRLSQHKQSPGKTCVTCGQSIGAEKHSALLLSYEQDVAAARSARDAAQAAMKLAAMKLAALAEPAKPIFPDLETARQSLQIEGTQLAELEGNVRVAVSDHKAAAGRLFDATERVQQLLTSAQTAEAAKGKLDAELAELEKLANRLEFWVGGFGNQGLKSFLIETEIAEINKRATGYAQRLLGAGAKVALEATTQLKTSDATREKLSVSAIIPGCTLTYAGASKGQKRRLDLSLLLAFRDLVATRSSSTFRQFFADELFDGVDATGVAYVVELLREIATGGCPVVLVTHDQGLKSAVDRVVTVQHDKEYHAMLVEKVPAKPQVKSKKAVSRA